jgi:hypothetical protein
MDEKWSWSDLAVIGPFLTSSFAFAYVVGYFYAFDIGWFPFFTVSDHLVFALRALPIAIGASAAFVLARSIKSWAGWAVNIWVCVLFICALLAVWGVHAGLALSLVLTAVAALRYNSHPDKRTAMIRGLHWATTLMVACLLVGYGAGNLWRWQKIASSSPLKLQNCMTINYKPDAVSPVKSTFGHVIFAGSSWVLIYDYKAHKALLRHREDIDEITEGCK